MNCTHRGIPGRQRQRANPDSGNEHSAGIWIPGLALRAIPE